MRFPIFKPDARRAGLCFLAGAALAACLVVSAGCSRVCGSCADKSAARQAGAEVSGMTGYLDDGGNWAPLPPGKEVPSTGASQAPAV
jgi:hypothetical protein